jgi:hypothetical protein
LLDSLIDEEKLIDPFMHLLDAVDESPYPNSLPAVLAVTKWEWDTAFHVIELMLGSIQLAHEQLHDILGLLPHNGLDGFSLGQLVECLQHLDALLNSRHALEGEVDDVLVHHVQILHAVLEHIEFVMPS